MFDALRCAFSTAPHIVDRRLPLESVIETIPSEKTVCCL